MKRIVGPKLNNLWKQHVYSELDINFVHNLEKRQNGYIGAHIRNGVKENGIVWTEKDFKELYMNNTPDNFPWSSPLRLCYDTNSSKYQAYHFTNDAHKSASKDIFTRSHIFTKIDTSSKDDFITNQVYILSGYHKGNAIDILLKQSSLDNWKNSPWVSVVYA